MKKKKAKNGPGRPPLHPYSLMNIGEFNVREFKTIEDRLNARCAVHMTGMRHGKKFATIDRLTDCGKFELTVKRVL
jgi:hypothetical protein